MDANAHPYGRRVGLQAPPDDVLLGVASTRVYWILADSTRPYVLPQPLLAAASSDLHLQSLPW